MTALRGTLFISYVFIFSTCFLFNVLSYPNPTTHDRSTYLSSVDTVPYVRSAQDEVSSLGFDFGTSGVRCAVVSPTGVVLHEGGFSWSKDLPFDDASSWLSGLHTLLHKTPNSLKQTLGRITVSGTSGSALLFDTNTNDVTRAPLMYNYDVSLRRSDVSLQSAGKEAMRLIAQFGDPKSPACAPTSALAKLLAWHLHTPLRANEVLLHQADYIAHSIQTYGNTADQAQPAAFSDWHNALKLGFDPDTLEYPAWLLKLLSHAGIDHRFVLPKVKEPGMELGRVSYAFAKAFGIDASCTVCAGTTDSIAAFIAAGATRPGQAVTSLGSTLAVKALSSVPVRDAARGVYSHRFGPDLLLAGGASNVGCAIFRQEGFDSTELQRRSLEIDPSADSIYKYYPLCSPGERFPRCDPRMQPRLQPKPLLPRGGAGETSVDRTEYLRALLQGIAYVEKEGYDALEELGATSVMEVLTSGGGAKNAAWTTMRQRILSRPVSIARSTSAAYGAALLGLKYAHAGSNTLL